MEKLGALFAAIALIALLGSVHAYSTYIYAPAVLENENVGTLTTISLNITTGNGAVTVIGPASVAQSTLSSAQTAAAYASAYLNVNETGYNFTYTINDINSSVSGPSAGLAFTILAISGIEQKPLLHDFTLTGTISPNGSVGIIGGAFDKAGAAKTKGLNFILVPASNINIEDIIYYITQQSEGIPLVPVSNVTQALGYVFAPTTIKPFAYNVSQNYYISSLPAANLSCTNCNISAYSQLANFTFNATYNEINSISGNYSSLKSSMLSQLAEYKELAGKGYLYSAADLSFVEYITAFTFANSGNLNTNNATSTINNVADYCNSLYTPQLTNVNYEFVTAGRIRQSWGNTTTSVALAELNGSQTGDDIIQSLYTVGSAAGWCSAAQELYNIGSAMHGENVTESQSAKEKASSLIVTAQSYEPSMYLTSAEQLYSEGYYAAALYSATYANVFENPSISSGYNNTQLVNMTLSNIANSNYGIWPEEFGLQAEFYLSQARLNASTGNGSILSAFETSELASALSADNKLLNTTFVPGTSTTGTSGSSGQSEEQQSSQLKALSLQVSRLYTGLIVAIGLLLLVFVILIITLLKVHNMQSIVNGSNQSSMRNKRRPIR